MSLKTWKAEFYPIDAAEATSSEAEALAHVKWKWIGLRPENLKKHGVKLNAGRKYTVTDPNDNSAMFINGYVTCALCQRHKHEIACSSCILRLVHGTSCYRTIGTNPYKALGEHGDPEPMLRLIERAEHRLMEKLLARDKTMPV